MMIKMPGTKIKSVNNLRTWIEIDSRAAKKNYDAFRKILAPETKLWSVVKSNAYGHGLTVFSGLAEKIGVDGFCVDSLVEGLRLRKAGIRKPVLVLGPTLSALFPEAAKNKITVTVSNFAALRALSDANVVPAFHLKIDTGMHRQGFYPGDLPRVVKLLKTENSPLKDKLSGIYTHFASAKDVNYPTYTEKQFAEFQKAIKLFEGAGFGNLLKHCSATGGALVGKKYHLDAVRVGIGLYGLWPSKELEMQFPGIRLSPVLSWRAVVSEVKNLKAGDYVGYDLVERVNRDTKMAVIPIGYWHGFPRSLSGSGEVLINGKRARVLGRVSMDLLAVGVGGAGCKVGDTVTVIGKSGGEENYAADLARSAGTIHYEFLTRLNPLMERILI